MRQSDFQYKVVLTVLLLFMQKALFATGTMAGSLSENGSWVSLCTADAGIKQVFITDSDSEQNHNVHDADEQCSFSAGALAHLASNLSHTQFSPTQDFIRSGSINAISRKTSFQRARAPPMTLS
ncbi:hypothetical protein A3715_08635 [Oleiphilus sp. HI0009]|nr:hypothetical protein A3715_08635 [Oleiphilus sp. HI0009]KZY63030.1 hypothetical protein A3738_02265 [Oleiphilus sp. HI0066]KZY71128.1 hypothetical protein A3738_24190 [Oleiphilus sp. HI0066]KZY71859.1 hypothetical protein A3739_16540 [Oleiphilus sp. HI0067]